MRRWQARQCQIEMRTGSPVAITRSWPQLHDASRSLTLQKATEGQQHKMRRPRHGGALASPFADRRGAQRATR